MVPHQTKFTQTIPNPLTGVTGTLGMVHGPKKVMEGYGVILWGIMGGWKRGRELRGW